MERQRVNKLSAQKFSARSHFSSYGKTFDDDSKGDEVGSVATPQDSVTHREISSVAVPWLSIINQLFQNNCISIDISDLLLQGEEKRQK